MAEQNKPKAEEPEVKVDTPPATPEVKAEEKASEIKLGKKNKVKNISKRDIYLESGILKAGEEGIASAAECCTQHKFIKRI